MAVRQPLPWAVLLMHLGACEEAMTWVGTRRIGPDALAECRPDWRAWLARKLHVRRSADWSVWLAAIQEVLAGSGYGDGSGDGYGSGDGSGSGDGYGTGYGYGYGTGSGCGDGYGDGDGHGSGDGSGCGEIT